MFNKKVTNPNLIEIKEKLKEKISEYKIRISVLGLPRAGKSSLVLRFINKNFFEDHETTIESEYETKLKINNKLFKLNILDTAGQEEFYAAKVKWFFKRDVFILAISLENVNLDYIDNLYKKDIKKNYFNNLDSDLNFENITIIIALTKCDLNIPQKNKIIEEIKNYAEINAFKFYKTSSKFDLGISELFEEICNKYLLSNREATRNILNKSLDTFSNLSLHEDYKKENCIQSLYSNICSKFINFCCNIDLSNIYEEDYKKKNKLSESINEDFNYYHI